MIEEKIATIYKITNSKNEYIYVGVTTKSLGERFSDHAKPSNVKKGNGLHKDMLEFGAENFKIEALDTCFERHRFIIEEHWYNKLLGEGNALYDIKQGATHSENTRQRIARARNRSNFDYSSESFKNKISKKTSGENNGMYGKKDKDALNGRIVVAMNEEYETVHTFPSVKMALKFLGIKGHNGLVKACRNNELYRGYFWKKEWIDR